VTNGGDGFRSQSRSGRSEHVYASLQHGVIVRFDKRTGERIAFNRNPAVTKIRRGWNWDTHSSSVPHLQTRLYMASDKLYRSDDRGDTWHVISGQLSRALDRDKLPVMGKIWSIDAVAKNASTAFYGNASALCRVAEKRCA
jgi:hypothetical protein